jgi:hypothetical protein
MNNNDWILASERLPDMRDSIFAKFKGTEKWDKTMFEKCSDTVLCTFMIKDKAEVTTGRLNDNRWLLDNYSWIKDYEVVAWMPFPKPYAENANQNDN